MWGNVFSERPEAVKCSNFLGGHFVFFKCCEFCTEAIEMPVANMFSRGRAPKTTGSLNILQLQDARKTHYNSPKPLYLYVLFISQPQSWAKFGTLLAWLKHLDRWVWAIAATHWRKRTANLRPVAQRTHELFARELVSIYEVKIPAR